jgi:tartrate-resistant acid phosphatase type 5
MTRSARARSIALVAAAMLVATAAPASAAPGRPGVVAVIGDFGSGTAPERQVAALVAALRPTDVVTTGDNVYSSAGYPALVGAYYPSWIRSHRFFPATGNHDYTEGITAFDRYFGWLNGQRTYLRTIGDLAFFVLDSQAALDSPAEMTRQRGWLKAALRASAARWRVVVLHHPPYSSGTVHGSTPAFRWPYRAWGANLVLSGHEHNYERLVESGLTYIVDGAGGKDLYRLGRPITGSTARDDQDYGALVLRSRGATLIGEYRSTSGKVMDRFTVQQ